MLLMEKKKKENIDYEKAIATLNEKVNKVIAEKTKEVQEFREGEAKVEATAEKIKNIDIDKE